MKRGGSGECSLVFVHPELASGCCGNLRLGEASCLLQPEETSGLGTNKGRNLFLPTAPPVPKGASPELSSGACVARGEEEVRVLGFPQNESAVKLPNPKGSTPNRPVPKALQEGFNNLATVCTSLSPRPEQLITMRGLPSSWGQRVSK